MFRNKRFISISQKLIPFVNKPGSSEHGVQRSKADNGTASATMNQPLHFQILKTFQPFNIKNPFQLSNLQTFQQ